MKKFIVIFLLICLFFCGSLYFWLHAVTQKIFISPNKTASSSINAIQQSLYNKTPINIVLLGYGGGTHDGAYLTDSIMVIHIDPKTQKVFLISVPRDIWIKIPTNGNDGSYWKINAAYELGLDDNDYPYKQSQFKGQDGAGKLAEYIVSQVTGLPIDYFVGMDFSGFKHTIDTLGGVDINVETAFTDSEYPVDGKETDLCGHQPSEIPTLDAEATQAAVETIYPCRYENLHFEAGLQHMDGEQALSYVRSRHSLQDGTDFGRAKRQRNLLVAVKAKIFSVSFIPQIIPFISSLGDDLRTDLSLDDVKIFLQHVRTLNTYQISTLALTDQNYLIDTFSNDGQAILEPKDGLDNWTSIHNYISDQLSGKTEPIAAIVQIENGTTIPGLAGLAVNRLKNENIQVLDPTDTGNSNAQITTITIYDKNINQTDIEVLKKEFGVTKINYLTSTQNQYNVLVVVGNDYNKKQGKKLLNEP
jgi:anionic cell wall polymer biosynthesis LytR-Cps2A-Psr (LCP) family protein